MNNIRLIAGFNTPAVVCHQLALYFERASNSLGHGMWTDRNGPTATWGLDLGRLRLRLLVDRTDGRISTGWGLH